MTDNTEKLVGEIMHEYDQVFGALAAQPTHWLLIIYEDVEAAIEGPFANDEARVVRAQEIRRDNGDRDGLHRLDIANGIPTVEDFGGGEFPDE